MALDTFEDMNQSIDELKEIYEEISQVFSERGSTILLVTHDSQEAEIMTKRQMKMEKGQLL